jgi:signal transduction histidine kinase
VHRHSLLQALQNVLQNGAEAYDAATPRIALHVAARGRNRGTEIGIEIRDEGSGMSDAQKGHLFVPFGSRKPGGTGVGLLIARKMIEDVHGGSLAIESAKGVGTTVTMRLPVKQTPR